MHARITFPVVMLSACAFVPLQAQTRALTAPGTDLHVWQHTLADDAPLEVRRGWSVLRVAKWSAATASAGTAVYGFIHNQRADEKYERLEQLCVDQPVRCDARLPNGAYADAELEAQYQDARAVDRRARTALVAGQVGVAASVVLFLLDLRNSDPPPNIPYEPRSFDVIPARDGGVSLRLNLRLPARL